MTIQKSKYLDFSQQKKSKIATSLPPHTTNQISKSNQKS